MGNPHGTIRHELRLRAMHPPVSLVVRIEVPALGIYMSQCKSCTSHLEPGVAQQRGENDQSTHDKIGEHLQVLFFATDDVGNFSTNSPTFYLQNAKPIPQAIKDEQPWNNSKRSTPRI